MAHAKAYIAVTAPTVNSYKRLKVGDPRSGATWAPAYVSYGYNNRTQMLRVPAPGRVEDRTVDGSCNPYLGAAVLLAAGLDGIERELDPGDPNALNLYETTAAAAAGAGHRHAAREPARRHARARARRRDPRARSAPRRRATTWTTSSSASAARCRPPTSRSRSGSSTATCRGSRRHVRDRRAVRQGAGGRGAARRRSWARCSARWPTAGRTRPAWPCTATRRRPARPSSRCSPRTRRRTGRRSGGSWARPTSPCAPPTPCWWSTPTAEALVRERRPDLRVMSAGERIEIYKEMGNPRAFVERFGLDDLRGSHGLGHTRMATESRVTTQASHPFSTGLDLLPRPQRLALQPQPAARLAAPRGDRVPDGQRHGGRRGLPHVAAARGRVARRGAARLPGGPGRLLHVPGRHGRRLRGPARPDRLQARRAGGDGRVGGDGLRVPRHRRAARAPTGRRCGSRSRRGCTPGSGRGNREALPLARPPAGQDLIGASPTSTSRPSTSPPRRCASSTRACTRRGRAARWRVVNPSGAHAVAVGVDADVEIDVEGHVGYYCAGMNKRATVRVHGNAGVGLAENIMSGTVSRRRLRGPVVRGDRPRRPRGRARRRRPRAAASR